MTEFQGHTDMSPEERQAIIEESELRGLSATELMELYTGYGWVIEL